MRLENILERLILRGSRLCSSLRTRKSMTSSVSRIFTIIELSLRFIIRIIIILPALSADRLIARWATFICQILFCSFFITSTLTAVSPIFQSFKFYYFVSTLNIHRTLLSRSWCTHYSLYYLISCEQFHYRCDVYRNNIPYNYTFQHFYVPI